MKGPTHFLSPRARPRVFVLHPALDELLEVTGADVTEHGRVAGQPVAESGAEPREVLVRRVGHDGREGLARIAAGVDPRHEAVPVARHDGLDQVGLAGVARGEVPL